MSPYQENRKKELLLKYMVLVQELPVVTVIFILKCLLREKLILMVSMC